MIEVQNSMGDTLAVFETENEASRFESAVELITSYQASRSNPASSLAEHPLLRSISGVEEIIDKVSFAIFGNAKTKVTDRAAPFIHFFFAERSGNLDDEFFYTLAAFTKKEVRKLVGLFHSEYAKHTEGELIGGVIESSPDLWHIGDFHSATPYMQVLYSYKLLGVLDRLEVEPHDESKHSHTREEHLQINDVDHSHPSLLTLYQSCSVQLCHINESFRVFGLGPIPNREDYENLETFKRAVVQRTSRFDEWLDLTVLEPLGVSLRLMQLTPTHFTKSTVQHMYLLSAIFTKIGDGFDEIQWGGLGLEKSLAVIERVALKSKPLTAEFIYKTYVLRQDVGTSYLRWALPLLIDMWRYQSRPSGNPANVRLTLEIANAIADKPDVLAYILTKTMDLAEKKLPISEGVLQDVLHKSYPGDNTVFIRDDADRSVALILMAVKRMFPNDLPAISRPEDFISTEEWYGALTLDDSLRELFIAVRDLNNKIPSDFPKPITGYVKGSDVEIIALEKYNPLSLFVGHSQVSNCCIYPGSQGEECGIYTFKDSGVNGNLTSKVEYDMGGSHMVLGYSHTFEKFVGSNWAWRPQFIEQIMPSDELFEGGASKFIEIYSDESSYNLSRMFVLDQFECSIWSTNIVNAEQEGYTQLKDFVLGITCIYSQNPYGYLISNTLGYTPQIVQTILEAGVKDTVDCLVHYSDFDNYSDFEDKDIRNGSVGIRLEGVQVISPYTCPNSGTPSCDYCGENAATDIVDGEFVCEDCISEEEDD